VSRLAPIVPIVLWTLIYPARMILSHRRFETNAYDLSIFDYALWNLPQGGFVPFFNKSLWSDHAMPTLAALFPIYWLSPGPATLIVVQAFAMLIAALLLLAVMRDRVSPLLAAALMFAFLFGRRSHSATMSLIYLESLEPALILAMVLAWQAKRWNLFAVFVALALGCKEDVAIYVAAFGVLMWFKGDRRAAVATIAVAICWLTIALTVLIPASRRHDHLPETNPLWSERFLSPSAAAERAFSAHAVGELTQLVAATGFIGLAAPEWLLVALPGSVANIAVTPEKQQSGVTGHYFWPVLPWLFVAAAAAAERIESRNRRIARVFAFVLIAGVTIDSPLWRNALRAHEVSAEAAARLREGLLAIPASASLTATANLVPHVPHRAVIRTLGINEPSEATEYVVLSATGNSWPLAADTVAARIACFAADAGFERIGAGDPAIFHRLGPARPLAVCPR
jgi:uncharacterized membrane protein